MITNYTINLDKLELQLRYNLVIQSNPLLPKAFSLSNIDLHNAEETYTINTVHLYRNHEVQGHYKLQYDVHIHNTPLGYIQLLPTGVISFYDGEPLVKISINNKLLYTPMVTSLLNTFLNTLNLSINNITRYDIALDSNSNSNDMLLDNFYNDDLHFMCRNRNLDNMTKVSTLYRNGDETASFYIGKRNYLQVAFYNKSKQTDTKVYKDYQKEFHHANGLDIGKDVYRIEVRVSRDALKSNKTAYQSFVDGSVLSITKYNQLPDDDKRNYQKKTITTTREVSVEDLVNPVTLLSLFKLDFESSIDFRFKDFANKDRCTKLQLIDFQQIKEYQKTTTMKDTQNNDTNMIKKQVKNLLELYKYGKDTVYWTTAQQIAYDNELVTYFQQLQAKLKVHAPATPAPVSAASFSLF